jgi:hypothetical protein
VPKKDTKAAVLAMLSEAGASRRLPSARDAAPAEPATDPEADHSAHTVEESLPSSSSADDRTESEQRSDSRVAEQQPAVGGKAETEAETETETVKDRAPSPGRSRRTEGRRTRPSVASADDTDHAPRTLRLDQGVANRLRAAWLEAKRDDILLSHTEYASQVVMAGLAAEERATKRA